MPSPKTIVTTAASVAASTMVVRSVLRDLVPYELQYYLFRSIRGFLKSFSSEVTVVIEEFDGLAGNQIYKAAELYLGNKISPTKMSIFVAKNQEVTDVFEGVNFKWRQITSDIELKRMTHERRQSQVSEVQYYQLKFHKQHKDLVFNSYFPFILNEGYKVQEARKTLKLYTLQSDHFRGYPSREDSWLSVNLHHPSTFDTLAMDSDLKKTIMEDLDRFVKRKDYYGRVGKAWKRGYLLIYDLELTNIPHNSQLRKVLLATENKSILVVKDIDCSLESKDEQADNNTSAPFGKRLSPRQSQVNANRALSLNDPPFPQHCMTDHPLFPEIEELMKSALVTPAEVEEQLLKNDDPDIALQGLLEFLHTKRRENSQI
ncbi:hypothetical protein EUGRSUZ_I01284 [Eucalyptus grandis]|uniref:Uncharacterized protein n=2 Tax=Eucalyptus grandis TaxID=71139 RepID=A0A059ANN3_EUCGR|nr:hypothetical protein EUGRSUZ_I01284 [Eucalyptus grandis]